MRSLFLRVSSTLLCCASLTPAWSQDWNLKDAGIGILDENVTPPRVVERDRPEWYLDDLTAKLGGRRSFAFWIVGPTPKTFVNRFGTPVYSYAYRETRQGDAPRESGNYSFSDEGWGTYQLNYHPGDYRLELYVIHRDTLARKLVKTFTYRVKTGKGAVGQPGTGTQPPPPIQTRPGKVPEVFLSDLPEINSGNIHGGLGKDHPYWAKELVIAGKPFKKGLVTHAPAENGRKAFVEYALNGEFSRFLAVLGSAGDQGNYGAGTMNFAVRVDGRVALQGRMPAPPATRNLDIDLKGARTLRLEVDNGGDGNNADQAAWGDARLRR